VHFKGRRRAPLVDEALAVLAGALVSGTTPPRPKGRVRRRAHRLAMLELAAELTGDSRARLTGLAEELGLVDDTMRTLRSLRAYARRTAADELAVIASRRAAGPLAVRLADEDAIVRVACVRGLAAMGELGEIEAMLRVLERDAAAAPTEAATAMLELAQHEPGHLVRLQAPGRAQFARRLAALTLGTTGDPRALPSLLAEVATDNALMASVALRAIARVDTDEGRASLAELVGDADRDPALREQAEHALRRLQAVGGTP
jgi:HEAT repeat protein